MSIRGYRIIAGKVVMAPPTEEEEQSALVEWARSQPWGGLFWHVPNGGYRHTREAAKFKRMGVLAGVPDLFLAMPRYWPKENSLTAHGLFIEMKAKGKYCTKLQIKMADELMAQNYDFYLANKGWVDAKEYIENYIEANRLFPHRKVTHG